MEGSSPVLHLPMSNLVITENILMNKTYLNTFLPTIYKIDILVWYEGTSIKIAVNNISRGVFHRQ